MWPRRTFRSTSDTATKPWNSLVRSRVSMIKSPVIPVSIYGRHYAANRTMDEPVPLIIRATAFAAGKHRNQRRKDAEASPYINHPIALASVLANEGAIVDPLGITAALLHDTIEDTETTAEELAAEFGADTARVVLEVTDDKSLDK